MSPTTYGEYTTAFTSEKLAILIQLTWYHKTTQQISSCKCFYMTAGESATLEREENNAFSALISHCERHGLRPRSWLNSGLISGDSGLQVIQHFVLLKAMASCEHTWQKQDVDHMMVQFWNGVDLLLIPDVHVYSVNHAIVLLIPWVNVFAADHNMKCRHDTGSIAVYCFLFKEYLQKQSHLLGSSSHKSVLLMHVLWWY